MKPGILHVCMKNKQDMYIYYKSHRLHIYICTHYIYKNLTLFVFLHPNLYSSWTLFIHLPHFILSVTRPRNRDQLKVIWIINKPTQDCVCSQSITQKCKYPFQSDLIFSSDLPTWDTALSQKRLLRCFMFTGSSARRPWLTLVRSNFSMNPSRPWDCCEPLCGKEVALDSSEWSLTVQNPLPILKTLLGESFLEPAKLWRSQTQESTLEFSGERSLPSNSET